MVDTDKPKEYTPSEVSDLIGMSPDPLRDRRRRGSRVFGQQVGKSRYKYLAGDILGLWASTQVEQYASNIFAAERMGRWLSGELAKSIGLTDTRTILVETVIHPSEQSAFADGHQNMFAPVRYAIFGSSTKPILTSNPRVIEKVDLAATVIVIRGLARRLPLSVVERLKADDRGFKGSCE